MILRISISDLREARSTRRPAFTFVEVLFAIIILGIGMIMLAAMLPVAINQTAQTRDQVTGKAAVEAGYAYIKAVAQVNPDVFVSTSQGGLTTPGPETSRLNDFLVGNSPFEYSTTGSIATPQRAGRVVPLTYHVTENAAPIPPTLKPLLQSLQGSRVSSADPTVQWIAFYRRDVGSSTMQTIILATRLQNRDLVRAYGVDTNLNTGSVTNTFENETINTNTTNPPANGPHLVPVEVEDRPGDTDLIRFVGSGPDGADERVAASGAYVIIAHSPPPGASANDDLRRPFRNNGRVLRLGVRREDLDTGGKRVWELDPEYEMESASAGPDFVLGTPDDVADGSMNPSGSYGNPAVSGTVAWAWIVGRGLADPTSPAGAGNVYQGLTQEIGVLKTTLTLD